MTSVVRLIFLCSACLQIALGIDLFNTFFRLASIRWGAAPPTFTRDVARRYGFPSETHKLVTDDGYVLHMTRIFAYRGQRNFENYRKVPILLMHGLLSSSDHWLLGGPGKDLPLLLAELGHDVWLGDWRGNAFSRGHTFLSPNNPSFWNFTYFNRAQHDLPVFIDRVLHFSQAPQLVYIGYSYGTTAAMILGSYYPEYRYKIKQSIFLAPVGYQIHDMQPAIQLIVDGLMRSYRTTTTRSLFELLPRPGIATPLWLSGCSVFGQLCSYILFLIFGQRHENADMASFDKLMHWSPSGCSSLDVIYLAQIFSKGFRGYDYGEKTNLYVYGQPEPPPVPVERFSIPVAMYYSPTDHLNSEQGVFALARRLRNVTFIKRVPIANFSHIDFMMGKNVRTHLYDDIAGFISSLR